MEAQRCPVCFGKGKVPAGFYQVNPEWPLPNSTGTVGDEVCRGCNGAGVVWGPPQNWQPPVMLGGSDNVQVYKS
jgi:DnaJ-class molecular chaperone